MFTPSPTILPSRTITAAKGPPLPVATFSVARLMARRRNSWIGVSRHANLSGLAGIAKTNSVCHRLDVSFALNNHTGFRGILVRKTLVSQPFTVEFAYACQIPLPCKY